MQSSDGKKYSTYILELIRNNGIIDVDGDSSDLSKAEEEVPFSFFMFDYFDILYCKKLRGEEKKYLNYLSLENAFEDAIQHSKNYRVSYKTLSLYCKSENERSQSGEELPNIFSITNMGESLSDIPFLGLIQISLCKDNYIGKNIEKIDIDSFLGCCESRIIEIAEEHKSANVRMQLFRSSTTGDFCLALRSDSIKAIYDIAIALNGTQNEVGETVKMLTFTNVGIECKYLKEKRYATLDENFVASHPEIVVALRFCADHSLRKELQAYSSEKEDCEVEEMKGLFGRYEYLLHIGLGEFSNIYPYLCEQKFGKNSSQTGKSELENILRKSRIRNINERILVRLEKKNLKNEDEPAESSNIRNNCEVTNDRGDRKEVFKKNKELFDNIKKLEKKKDIFQEEHFAFQDLLRGMKEIYKAFSSAGMDKESYVNWRIFHDDMNILCGCINETLDYYEKWEKNGDANKDNKKWYRGIILGDWRMNLQAITRYTTLVQNVNYQTYQAPIYEIQTQIDTEKAMVAYREAMTLYIIDGIRKLYDEDDKEMVFPIIYPDLSKDRVEIAAPFMVQKPDGFKTNKEIICTVPSFEYFCRLYDLLPWIIHETSHHLRVIKREDRNRFVTKYIFSSVFKEIMREPLGKLSNYTSYKDFGIAENYLVASMSEIAQEDMFAQGAFKNFNFERLIVEINNWFKRMFPFGAGYRGRVHIGMEEQLKKQMFDFWLDAYRKENILTDSNLDMILRIWDGDIPEEKEILAKSLLNKYFDNLPERLKDEKTVLKIYLEDLYNYEDLEMKMAKWAQVSEQNKAVAREYCYKILAVYRIMKIDLEGSEKKEDSKQITDYLQKVFERYKNNYREKTKKNNIMADTIVVHILRNLGLMNNDSELFIKKMGEIMRNIDNSAIMEHKDRGQRTYMEAYADILMAASLGLTGFGYCRQVFLTVSDAKLMDREDRYEDINYERWRTVAAVLLDKDGAKSYEIEGRKKKIYAKSLIEDGKTYCKYTIRCIFEKISKLDVIKDDENMQKRLKQFLGKIYLQIEQYLGESETEYQKNLLLYILLYGDKEKCSDEVRKVWDEYEDVAKFCNDAKYNFWRIDCFCWGIGNILQDGYIVVSKELFDHIKTVFDVAKGENDSKRGCSWERDYEFLTKPRRDVGDYYNTPELVYEKLPDQKLDNTIDFIQNYYYYNRFRIMNESADFSAGNKK